MLENKSERWIIRYCKSNPAVGAALNMQTPVVGSRFSTNPKQMNIVSLRATPTAKKQKQCAAQTQIKWSKRCG